ncbi:MAG: hypothetical protein PHW56_10660 [Methanosarcinaceae archaeon]|nr:hypothetical protein [Methanosarcinaceae archaeon]
MKTRAIITIAILISATLLAINLSPVVKTGEFSEGDYIRLERVEMAFNGTGADVSVHYQLSPFAQTYMFLFGSKHLEPKIDKIFFDFEDPKILEIGRKEAMVRITNVSRPQDEYFLHESHKLGMQPDMLVLIDPKGKHTNIANAAFTPDTFYRKADSIYSE